MTDFNPTIITTVIAVVAIISPVITTLIDNIFRLISKKMEYNSASKEKNTQYRQNIIENYIQCAGACIVSSTTSVLENYKKSYALVLLHVPSEIQKQIIEIDRLM